MQPYDYLMLMVLAGLTLYGYSKGMAWQVAYLASLVVSYFVAVKFADQIKPLFGDSEPFNKFLAMLAIYIATSLGIWILFRYVRGIIDRVRLESFDHQMGAIIGFGRGVLWCVGLTFFAVGLLPQTQKQQIIESHSGRYIAVLLDRTDSMVPPEIHQVIGPVIHTIEQRLDPNAVGHGVAADQTPAGAGFGWPTSAAQPTNQPAPAAASQPGGPFGWPSSQPPQGGGSGNNFGWPSAQQNPGGSWPNQ
ncbi:Colicin V production protein [Pirellulimonas nuda]|uniref:Colicin V production protein n=2 Tax=Pirellulimonas nuda TaxID=2528009 RepID=A0A518DA98_9BACT|nr:Colicin V production protein [Pirellulimonas nuda]